MIHEVSTLCRFSAGSDQTLVLRGSVSFSDCDVVDLTKRKTIGRDLMNSRHMRGNVRDFAKLAIKAFVGLQQADRIFVRLLSALSTFIFAFFCVSPAFACTTFGITISADKNSAIINDYVTISVTISGGASYSSGSQWFHLVDGGTTLISDSPVKGGGNFTQNYTIQLTSAKTYSIQGVIDGGVLACASTSNIATVTVNKPSTTITLYVTNAYTNGASSNYGDPVDIVALISPAGATGTVTFEDGGTTLGTGTPNGGGYASFQTSSLSVGTHSITAVYDGDGSYAGSTSSAVSFPVNKNSTGTSITSSSYNPNPGQNITLTANISPSVNSGSVTFKDGSNTIASGMSVSGGSASFATSSLSAGSHNITAEYTGDSNYNASTSSSITVTVGTPPTASANTTAKNLTVGTTMSSFTPLTGSGGTAPLIYYVSSGSLPSGLSLNSSSGAVTGTPSAPYNTANVVFSVKDSINLVATTTSSVSFTVSAAPTAISGPTTQTPTVGTPMSFTPLSVSGGARPLTYFYSGTLPPGLTFDASTGQVAGTPSGPYSTASVVFSVKDANNVVAPTTNPVSFTVASAPTATAAAIPAKNLTVGTAISSFTPLAGSGGTAPLTYYVSSGSLPSGISLNSSSGEVGGTPSAPYSTANVVFSVRDANNSVPSTTSSVSFTVSAIPTASANTTAQTPTVGTPMSFTPLSVSGGARPLTYYVSSGTLPPGLTLDASTGQVAGTPSGPYSTASVVFEVKDANNVVAPTTNSVSFTVASAPTATANTTAQNLTVGTAMSSFTPLSGSGGTAPLTYYVSSGSLPSGLSLNSSSGAVTGTPSAAYSTANVVFSVKDANNSVPSTTSSVSFTVSVAPTASAGPTAQTPTVGTPMSFTPLSVSGGARPLTYYVRSGTLPLGLTLDASTGQVAGTPSGPYSTASVVFEVKDANNVVAPTTNSVSFTVASAPTATANTTAQNLTVGTAMSSFTPLSGSGGTAPLTYYVSSGSLPTGLSLNSSSGAVTGTPTVTYSTANVVFAVRDANGSVPSTTSSVSFTVSAIPAATANTTAQTLMFGVAMPAFTPLLVAGGARPLTYYVSSGTLPPGLSLNASTGAVTGTPTAIYSTANVVFSVKDANNVVATTTSSVNFRVLPATTTITITSSSATPTFGKSVQFTATIAPQTATGTVTFKDGTIVLGAVTVSGGNASFTTSSLSLGAHSITAIYSGDVNHVSSTSSPMIVTSTRPNPANDPNVRGIAISQVSTAQRTAQQTISTVQRRLETIHSDDTPGFSNGIGFSVIEPQSRFGQQQAEKEANPLAYSDMKQHGIVDPAKLLLRKEGEPASSNPINGAASVLSPDFNAWTAGSIIIGDQSYTGQVNQSRFSMSAVTAGIDTRVRSDMKAGFAVGLSTDRTKINNDTASNNGTSVTGTAYVSWQAAKGLFIDSLVGYGRLNFSSSRYDSNAGSSITGARTGSVLFGSVIASFEQRMGAFQYAPYGGFDILMGKLNAYTEAGDADWVLSYASASVSSQGLILGFRGQYDMPMSWGMLSPTARVQFRHGMSGNVTQSMNYTADTSTSYALSISGTEQNSITSSIGLRAQSTAGTSGQFEYLNNVMMNGRQSNGLRGMLMIPF